MEDYQPKRFRHRPRRSAKDRAMAQLRRYWEPQDLSGYDREMPDIVKKTMSQLGLQNRFDEQKVFEAWGELVGDFVAQNSRPVSVNRKVLFIQVLHPTVHYELERMKGQILSKMQNQFGAENIREVRFRIG